MRINMIHYSGNPRMNPVILACAWLAALHRAGAAWDMWPSLDKDYSHARKP